MSFFRNKKPELAERIFVVLPGTKNKALDSKKDTGRLNLKKDLARFMHKHRNDKFDTRRLSSRSIDYR